jgi:hypothetical protein
VVIDAAGIVAGWAAGMGQPAPLRALAVLAAVRGAPGELRQSAQQPVGTGDAALLQFRRGLLGDVIDATTTCTACATRLEISWPADQLLGDGPAADEEPTAEVTVGGVPLRLRAVTPADLVAAGVAPDTMGALLARCVTVGASDVGIADLPDDAVAELGDRLAGLDPRADVVLALCCPSCDSTWEAPIDVAALVWAEIDAVARGLLFDVHRLAAAYGWSHEQVLNLPDAVRRSYLELVP